ncbi:MAG TPA: MFS transporter [Kribbella sp.]
MTPPLVRNRNYRLLWSSQALSEFGLSATSIAFPLLVLAVTGSPAASGLVLGTSAAAQLLVGLPAGALVDRWNRKKVMLCCEAAQAVAAASLVAALWYGQATVAHMVVVAAILGMCGALFEPAEDASLPSVVPAEQVSTAVAMNAARSYLGQLSGTAAGGFLFAVGRFVPFAVDALTHAISFFALIFLRLPKRNVPAEPVRHLGREIATGLRWVWQQDRIRVIALCAIGLNLFFSAYYIVIIVLAVSRGVSSGQIGIMAAMLGVGGILGALAAPYLQRMLNPYVSIIGVFWALTLLTPLAVFIANGYLLGALFATMAFLAPTANTTIDTYLLLLTPDELRGRMSSVIGVALGTAAVLAPALGGVLMQVVPGGRAVLICASGIAIVTVLATVSRTLRDFPRQVAGQQDDEKENEQAQEEDDMVVEATSEARPGPVRVLPVRAPQKGESDMDDDARYEVLRNDEEQYSLWLAGHEVPAGWHRVGKEGTKEECSAYVDEVWTDMRPRSLRERMDKATPS